MKLVINHQSKIPLHVQVEELLRKLIASPEFKNGNFLPKEVELANRLGVSRSTIRQAAGKLENEGLLARKRGLGTTVAQPALSTGLDHWYSFAEEMLQHGVAVANLDMKAEKVKADEKVARFFNVPLHRNVVKLTRLRGTEGEPFVYFESYFHPRIGMTGKEDFTGPLYRMMEDAFGVVVVRSNEHISARLAGPMAKRLKIDPRAVILLRERFVYDSGDRPIEYNIGYYRADRFTYAITIPFSSKNR
ncbi:GntR family transcriptional regulator [Dinghuibacter silviterrae]|uniref:GntR family transcriptional regulator n=1 Tax=Dinghuibacter silviterrae TaxID=1539049 RepID=A0A4R8DEH7_9BACT|nr:GntR family transcriptional regulator [Dinghuibacter silviterrae]TDW95929.1 GntR family transcriptional regulator [Dinghuibacter silviterrae]